MTRLDPSFSFSSLGFEKSLFLNCSVLSFWFNFRCCCLDWSVWSLGKGPYPLWWVKSYSSVDPAALVGATGVAFRAFKRKEFHHLTSPTCGIPMMGAWTRGAAIIPPPPIILRQQEAMPVQDYGSGSQNLGLSRAVLFHAAMGAWGETKAGEICKKRGT